MERAVKKLTLAHKFSKNLRDTRRDQKMTQARLAELSGITREYVVLLEHRVKEPTLGVVERLAKALRVKPTDLLR